MISLFIVVFLEGGGSRFLPEMSQVKRFLQSKGFTLLYVHTYSCCMNVLYGFFLVFIIFNVNWPLCKTFTNRILVNNSTCEQKLKPSFYISRLTHFS